jgi:RNA-directed DNA polymerase
VLSVGVDKDLGERKLNNFPERTGIRVQDLSNLCSKLDWLDQNTQSKAQALIKAQLQAANNAFERQTKTLRVSKSIHVKNLIASSDLDDLEVFRLLFANNKPFWKEVLGDQFAKINAVLPQHSKSGNVIKQILSGRVLVSGQSLGRIAPRKKKAICITLFEEIVQNPAMSKSECIALFLAKLNKLVDTSHPDQLIDLIVELAPSLSESLNSLNREDIDALPNATRKAILKSEKSRSIFLEPGLFKEFVSDPRTHLDSLESILTTQNVSDALECVANGRLGSNSIKIVLNDQVSVGMFCEGLNSALRKCSKLKLWKTSNTTASAVAALPPSIELKALEFFSKTYGKRADVLISCQIEFLLDVVRIIGPENAVDALSNSNLLGDELIDIASLDVLQKPLLNKFSNCSLSKPERWRYFPPDYEAFASTIADVKILKLFEILVRSNLIQEPDFNKFLNKIRKLPSFEKCSFMFDPSTLIALWNAGPRGTIIVTELMTMFRSNRNEKLKWLRQIPLQTVIAIGGSLTAVDLVVAIESPHRNSLGELFHNSLWRERSVLWPMFLKVLKTGKTPIPAFFRSYLRRNPNVLLEVFSNSPDSCIPMALKQLSLPQILPMAFKSKRVALAVEKKWSRRRLQSYIGWVQQVAEKNSDGSVEFSWPPQISAAYQCALAFGLQYSNFLVSLSKQVKREPNASKRGFCFDHLYSTYPLPKKSGGIRVITAPDEKLKSLQRAILHHGFTSIDKSPSATGFRRGTSIVRNAEPHVGKKVVVNVDIKGFFPNTPQALIRGACQNLVKGTLSEDAQILVAELCGYKGALPTGAPTSPAIANVVLAKADKAIRTVCRKKRISFTRYADDLTFSGNGDVLSILPFVRKVLADFGFELDSKKTNIFRKGRRQIVTGLVVNEKPNLARPVRKKIRAAVHNRSNGNAVFWHDQPMSDNELMGRIAFLAQTQPEEAKCLREKLEQAMSK